MSLELSDLPDDMIQEIFSHLSPWQLFRVQRVNLAFHRCANVFLSKIKTITFSSNTTPKSSFCPHLNNFNKTLVISRQVIDKIGKKAVNLLVPMLTNRFRDVECLDLRNVPINVNYLTKIAKGMPKLECLCIGEFDLISRDNRWNSFVQSVGPKLVHLSVKLDKLSCERFSKLLSAGNFQLIDIELVVSNSSRLAALKQLKNLDQVEIRLTVTGLSCKELALSDFEYFKYADYLTIDLTPYIVIAGHLKTFNRLKHLEVTGKCDIYLINRLYITSTSFPVLESLRFDEVSHCQLKKMSNYQFGRQLKSLQLKIFRVTPDKCLDAHLSQWFSQTPHLKQLVIENESDSNALGYSLTLLSNLEVFHCSLFINQHHQTKSLVEMLELLPELKKLKNIRVNCQFIECSEYFFLTRNDKKKITYAIDDLRLSKTNCLINVEMKFNCKYHDQSEFDVWKALINRTIGIEIEKQTEKWQFNSFTWWKFIVELRNKKTEISK